MPRFPSRLGVSFRPVRIRWDAIMRHGGRARSVAAHFVLFALAIQGITPDARDLASLNALRVFSAYLADSSSLADDDESADQVCGSAEVAVHLTIRKRMDSRALPLVGVTLSGPRPPSAALAALQSARPLAPNICFCDFIHILCRLTC
jgi:hypothetical protein